MYNYLSYYIMSKFNNNFNLFPLGTYILYNIIYILTKLLLLQNFPLKSKFIKNTKHPQVYIIDTKCKKIFSNICSLFSDHSY